MGADASLADVCNDSAGEQASAISSVDVGIFVEDGKELVLTDEFKNALEIFNTGRSAFLTGKAGTGKSTLVRHFIANTARTVVVAAPTGIAALNVDGVTVHSLFGFVPSTTLEDVLSDDYYPSRNGSLLREIDTLIVDEASMIRADLFDMIAAALDKYGPRPGTPFGGVQLILVGDLCQLPPVVAESLEGYFETRYKTPYFFSADRFSADLFPTISLTKVFRQLGDDRLTGILNGIREGILIKDAADVLNQRVDPIFEPPEDEFWVTLTTTNPIAEARNNYFLERLSGREWVSESERSGDLERFDPPTSDRLRIKIGAQVMMLSNHPAGYWVNGTMGRIVSITGGVSGPVVRVELASGKQYEVSRHTWEVSRPSAAGGKLKHDVVGTFSQLPFKLAWAITIHKSQGQTLDRMIVDLSGGTFAFGQLYVALSRCTSMDGLILRKPVLPKELKTDPRVTRFLQSSSESVEDNPRCGIAIVAVGRDGRLGRPRPVELAVAFEDGSIISSIINPQRDMGDALRACGISASDVLLAPTLDEAWSVLSPMLAGHVPVGVNIDQTLGFIDAELKRRGRCFPLRLGVDISSESLNNQDRGAVESGSAEAAAMAALRAYQYATSDAAGAASFDSNATEANGSGYLLSRGSVSIPSSASRDHGSAALLKLCRHVSPILIGHDKPGPAHGLVNPELATATSTVAKHLREAAARVVLTPDVMARLRRAEEALQVDVLDDESASAGRQGPPAIGTVLFPGARVCFTGTAYGPGDRQFSRDEMEKLATSAGLQPVDRVTKSKCEALIVAEIGSQSRKSLEADRFGKPVYAASEFFAWLARRG